jgi:hypothetical protein
VSDEATRPDFDQVWRWKQKRDSLKFYYVRCTNFRGVRAYTPQAIEGVLYLTPK